MASSSHTEKDLILRVIYNELGRVTLKWFKIGIQLGIPHHKLKEFEEKERDPLSAVIEYWLAGNVPDSCISWKSIAAALEVNCVGEPGLAEHIYQKYCNKVEGVPSTKSDQNKHEKDAEDSTSQPPLDGQLDPNVKMDLECILEENLYEISSKYASYVDCLREMIKEKPVSPEDLRSYLLSLPAFSKAFKGQSRALLFDQKTELTKKNTINEIFDFLTMKCASFLHYDIFQMIIKKYSINTEREELKYYDHLKDYIHKHKISEFVMVNPLLKNYTEDSNKLILKFDIENTCTLARVDELKKNLAKILKLKPSTLQIVDIEEGCVVVTFHIPASVAAALFTSDTAFTSQQEDELRAASVLWLQWNGYTFNFRKSDPKKEETVKSSGLRKLREQLTCSICLGTYTDPKLLQCSHSFCQRCLLGLRRPYHRTITCPTCRQATPIQADGVAGLPSDFRTNQLLDIVGENWKGIANYKMEASSPENSNPVRVSLEATPTASQIYCPEHEKEIQLYCETCVKCICYRCVMKGGEHHSHDCDELDETFKKGKEEIPKLLAIVEKALVEFETCGSEISDQKVAIDEAIHNTILPDARKLELSQQLHQHTKSKLKKLAMQKDKMETAQLQLNRILRTSMKVTMAVKRETVQQVNKLTSLLQPEPSVEANTKLSDIVDVTAECQRYGVVSANLPDLSKCYATGEGTKLSSVGDKSSVVLHTLDFNNQPCKGINMEVITSQLVSEETGTSLSCRIKRKSESEYQISYQPTIKGRQKLHIKINGHHIEGSPFSVITLRDFCIPIQTIDGVTKPSSIAVNQKGEMIVIEGEGQCVTTFSPTGERLQSFNTSRSGLGSMENRVSVGGEGTIFVANPADHYIRKFTSQGRLIEEIDITEDQTSSCYPKEIASNVKLHTRTGSSVHTFGRRGGAMGQLINPQHAACDSKGNIYVADWGNHRIQVFTAEGKSLRMFGRCGELIWPYGITVDVIDRVYVSKWDNHSVSVFTSEGQFLTSFGGKGSEPGQFKYPCGLATDSCGLVHVCDTENNRIQAFKVHKHIAVQQS